MIQNPLYIVGFVFIIAFGSYLLLTRCALQAGYKSVRAGPKTRRPSRKSLGGAAGQRTSESLLAMRA